MLGYIGISLQLLFLLINLLLSLAKIVLKISTVFESADSKLEREKYRIELELLVEKYERQANLE